MKLTLKEVLPHLDHSNAGGLYNLKPLSTKLRGIVTRKDWIKIIIAEGMLYRELLGVPNYHEDDVGSYIDAFIRLDRIHITEDRVSIIPTNYCDANRITVEHFPSHCKEILYGDVNTITPKERSIVHILGCQHTPIFSMEHLMMFDEIQKVDPVVLESHCRLQYLTEEAVVYAQQRMEKLLHTKRSFFPSTFNWKLNTIKRHLSSKRDHKNALMTELEKRFTVKVDAKRQDPAKIYRKSPVTIDLLLKRHPELLDISILCPQTISCLIHNVLMVQTNTKARSTLANITLNHNTLQSGVWGKNVGGGIINIPKPILPIGAYEAIEQESIDLIKDLM